ncbi:MAG TPA: LacI family DNA-binding transcriptional regulator [Chthoniobacteraceae bacterium]|jgi:DNA-binding LacI/PurR family transcriptional regulator|nr:LacI family DNA-binding transcriptional regulator [Chthoniobacteraceae bacterium]
MRADPIPNLAAIARQAGVSRMTVSRALRNMRGVNPKTRALVLSAAEKVGYRPNPLVSAFMVFVRTTRVSEDCGVLAYITTSSVRGGWRSFEPYARFFHGATARADAHGYRMEEFWLRERGMTMHRLSDILYARGIRGLVIGPMESSHAHLNLDWSQFSSSAICFSLLKPELPRATNDQYNSMLLALRELRKRGYKRIGMVMTYGDNARVRYLWSAAFLFHHWRYHRAEAPHIYLPAVWNDDAALKWIRRNRLEAIVTTQTHYYGYLIGRGIDIPGELGILNLDWTKLHAPMSGIDQETEQVGSAAVDLAVNQLNNNESGIPRHPKTVLLAGSWVPGSTVRHGGEPSLDGKKWVSRAKALPVG